MDHSSESPNTVISSTCGLGGSWLRKSSVGPVDPGCLLAILPSSSQSDPTLRPRISHQNLVSHRWMSKSCLIFWRLQAVNFYAHEPPVFASWHLSRAPTVRTVTNAAKIMVRNTIVYIWEIRKWFFFFLLLSIKKNRAYPLPNTFQKACISFYS